MPRDLIIAKIEKDELTLMMKLRRDVVADGYRDSLDDIYAGTSR